MMDVNQSVQDVLRRENQSGSAVSILQGRIEYIGRNFSLVWDPEKKKCSLGLFSVIPSLTTADTEARDYNAIIAITGEDFINLLAYLADYLAEQRERGQSV